jgi:hypothetical protein
MLKKILIAVAGFWLTTGLVWRLSRPDPVPANHPEKVSFGGRVVDEATDRLIEGAEVTVSIGSGGGSQLTDSEGAYTFSFPPLGSNVEARMTVAANNYQTYTRNLGANSAGDLISVGDVMLKPLPNGPPQASQPVSQQRKLAGEVRYKARSPIMIEVPSKLRKLP